MLVGLLGARVGGVLCLVFVRVWFVVSCRFVLLLSCWLVGSVVCGSVGAVCWRGVGVVGVAVVWWFLW